MLTQWTSHAPLGSRVAALGYDGRLVGNGIFLGQANVPGYEVQPEWVLLDNGCIAFAAVIKLTPENPSPPMVVEIRESTRFFLKHGEDDLLGLSRLRKGEKIALRGFAVKRHQGQHHVAASFDRDDRECWVIVNELKLPVA